MIIISNNNFTPERTSLNQVASGIKFAINNGVINEGDVIVDYGGGRYDKGLRYLESYNTQPYIFDIYSRDCEYNLITLMSILKEGGADVVMYNNVLNVIPDLNIRKEILRIGCGLLKSGGYMLITIYEGDKSGNGDSIYYKDGWTWQENRKFSDYNNELSKILPDMDLINKKNKVYLFRKN